MLEQPAHLAAFRLQRTGKKRFIGSFRKRGQHAFRPLLRDGRLRLQLARRETQAMHLHNGQMAERIRQALSALREWWRGASGTHAYGCYLHHVEKNRTKPLTPQEFYL